MNRLLARGETVRVLARHRCSLGDGVEMVEGDVRDPAAAAQAVAGVRTVVAAMHGFAEDPRGIDGDGNAHLIEAAQQAGVDHFLLVSVRDVAADHPIEMFRMKSQAEERLRCSGLAWTIIRPTAFMETWLQLLGEPMRNSGRVTIFGRGSNPINFVSVADVACLIDRALRDPSMRGAAHEIGGPQDLSLSEFADLVARTWGLKVVQRHVPVVAMRVMSVLMRAIKPALARQIAAGVVMDTRDMRFDAPSWPGMVPTTLAQVAQRDHPSGLHPA
ncbi:MAG: NAD(P)H-binding protein [Dokdonella sp.]